MSYTLQQLFGESATYSSGALTFQVNDLKDENGNLLIGEPVSVENQWDKIGAALLAYMHRVTKPVLDTNGNPVEDKTKGIVSQDSFSPKTFEVRITD